MPKAFAVRAPALVQGYDVQGMTAEQVSRLVGIADSLLPGAHSVGPLRGGGLLVRGPYSGHPETGREIGKEARRIVKGAKVLKVKTYTVQQDWPSGPVLGQHVRIEVARDLYQDAYGRAIVFDDATGRPASRSVLEG